MLSKETVRDSSLTVLSEHRDNDAHRAGQDGQAGQTPELPTRPGAPEPFVVTLHHEDVNRLAEAVVPLQAEPKPDAQGEGKARPNHRDGAPAETSHQERAD